MISSSSGILVETASTLIKTFFIVFFLNLYYTLITYDGRKCNKQRANSNKQQAESNEQRPKSKEQRAKTNEQQATSKTFSFIFPKPDP